MRQNLLLTSSYDCNPTQLTYQSISIVLRTKSNNGWKLECRVGTFVEALQHGRDHLADLGENIFACFGNHWRVGHNCHLGVVVEEAGLSKSQSPQLRAGHCDVMLDRAINDLLTGSKNTESEHDIG